jgi:hypothetical protein
VGKLFALLLVSLLGFPSSLFASDIFVGQTAAGANNGTSCANAYAFNDATHGVNNNQAASFVAGNVLHVCGVWNSATNGQQWILGNNNGASGNPITIKFETGAAMYAPYHNLGGAIRTNGTWYVIDGGTNGIIANTLNGTASYAGCLGASLSGGAVCTQQQQQTRQVYFQGANTEVKNFHIGPGYVIQPGSGDANANSEGIEGIYFCCGNNNETVDHNTIHDMNHGIDGWGDHILEYNNEVYNCGRCVLFGPAVSNDFVFHDNSVHDLGIFDGTGVHEDGIHLFPSASGQHADNVVLYNNLWYNPGTANTAFMYFEGQFGNGTNGAQQVFNNVCILAANQADFCIVAGEDTGQNTAIVGALFANNTCVGGEYGPVSYNCYTINSQSGAAGYTNFSFYNNVHILGGQKTAPLQGSLINIGTGSTVANINNNMYEDVLTDGGGSNVFSFHGSSTSSFTTWKGFLPGGSGQDAASVFDTVANLHVSLTTGQLQVGSLGIGGGKNLTSLGITALNCDKPVTVGPLGTGACTSRPSVGAWDIGASQFGTAPVVPSPAAGMFAVAISKSVNNPIQEVSQ